MCRGLPRRDPVRPGVWQSPGKAGDARVGPDPGGRRTRERRVPFPVQAPRRIATRRRDRAAGRPDRPDRPDSTARPTSCARGRANRLTRPTDDRAYAERPGSETVCRQREQRNTGGSHCLSTTSRPSWHAGHSTSVGSGRRLRALSGGEAMMTPCHRAVGTATAACNTPRREQHQLAGSHLGRLAENRLAGNNRFACTHNTASPGTPPSIARNTASPGTTLAAPPSQHRLAACNTRDTASPETTPSTACDTPGTTRSPAPAHLCGEQHRRPRDTASLGTTPSTARNTDSPGTRTATASASRRDTRRRASGRVFAGAFAANPLAPADFDADRALSCTKVESHVLSNGRVGTCAELLRHADAATER